jgi:dTDP-glucose 4,6-dehydratase
MRILVTGGAGFIGSHFVDALIETPDLRISKVIVLDKLTYAGNRNNLAKHFENSKFGFFHGDINDRQLVEDLVREVDWVVNFAAESHVDNSIQNSREFITSNIVGVDTLLNAVKNANCRFLQISTDEVYGSLREGSATESTSINPSSSYSASKASADLLALAFFNTFKLDIRITRTCNNFGPRQFIEKLIPVAICAALKGDAVPIYGDGLNIREWLPVRLNCQEIINVMKVGQPGNVYNIGSGLEITNLEIVQKILNLTNSNSRIEFITDRKGHDYRYSLNSEKLYSITKQRNSFDLDVELNKTIAYYALQQDKNSMK